MITLNPHCGIVQNFALDQVLLSQNFLQNIDSLNDEGNTAISGQAIHDALKGKKDKKNDQPFFNCCMFLGLDQNTSSLVYFNLDALIAK